MAIQESGEMYLETILILSNEQQRVRAVDISERMGFSKPSVSRAVGILREEGLINVDPQGFIILTDTGLEKASKIYDRHTLLADALTKIGVDSEIAAADACRIEHVISDETIEAIKLHLSKVFGNQ